MADGAPGGALRPRRSLSYKAQEPGRNRRVEAPRTRPVTSAEPRAYLAAPVFSNCTVPLLLVPSWRFNFFHVYRGALG